MKIRHALAASVLALGIAVSGVPAMASVVTDDISFSITGSYGVGGAPWEGAAIATGSFAITFDPTQIYPDQGLTGFISDLTYSVTDPRFGSSPLVFNPISSFEYAYGTLTLFSDYSLGKAPTGTPNITIGINGWGDTQAADVWYSQTDFADTLTISGGANITVDPTPLPSTWTMLIAGLVGLGLFAYRGKKKRFPAIAAA
jgi:hypothetical protein